MSLKCPDPDELVQCAYNPAHQVQHHRMQFHLEKCRKQYPNAFKSPCPFDSSHSVNSQELDFHVMTCPNRYMFDTKAYVLDDGGSYVAPVHDTPNVQQDEDWDNDNFVTYRPAPPVHVIQKIKGATPSERKTFRSESIRNFKPKE